MGSAVVKFHGVALVAVRTLRAAASAAWDLGHGCLLSVEEAQLLFSHVLVFEAVSGTVAAASRRLPWM